MHGLVFSLQIFECCDAGFLIEVLSAHEWFVSGSSNFFQCVGLKILVKIGIEINVFGSELS